MNKQFNHFDQINYLILIIINNDLLVRRYKILNPRSYLFFSYKFYFEKVSNNTSCPIVTSSPIHNFDLADYSSMANGE